jgi:diadenylate cyclase
VTFVNGLLGLHPGWRDLLEIALVAFVFYRGLLLISGTRAMQILAGLLVLVACYAAAWVLKLPMLTYLLGLVFTYGLVALLIIFQPEVRAALASLGRGPIAGFARRLDLADRAGILADAAMRLAARGTGAIIAVAHDVSLRSYIESGTALQAEVSADLLGAIFAATSPLHDGAVIVRSDMIVAAGCILPLSHKPLSDRTLGTRHRAAIGLSEETDAIVLVVSEETGTVSVAENGVLTRDISEAALRALLSGRRAPDVRRPAVDD